MILSWFAYHSMNYMSPNEPLYNTMKGPRNLASKRTSVRFSIKHSTNSLYETSAEEEFVGPFAHIRSTMDYAYHNNYTKERQWLQDSIIDKLLSEIITGEHGRENEDSQITETRHSRSFSLQKLRLDLITRRVNDIKRSLKSYKSSVYQWLVRDPTNSFFVSLFYVQTH